MTPRYKKILVLVDLSNAGEQVAIAGRDLAAGLGASVVILHAAHCDVLAIRLK